MAAALVASPLACCGLSAVSCLASCGLSLLCRACCSVAGCCLPRSASVGKLFYLLLFCAAAVLGIALRYTGQAALSGWASLVAEACNAAGGAAVAGGGSSVAACFGLQAAYRVSASLCGFFVVMLLLTAALPVAHHGAWLLKLALFLLLLGCSVLVPNSFFDVYAQLSRYGSIVFLVIQVVIIIDFAYVLHEALLRRIDARQRALDANAGSFEPGALSNGWKVLYVAAAAALAIAAIACTGAMFPTFGKDGCPLPQFFLSETLVVGVILVVASGASRGAARA